MNFINQRVLIIGMGKSGVAAAQSLARRGALVTLCDRNPKDIENREFAALIEDGVNLFSGGYPTGDWDLIIVSPGVPLTEEPLVRAQAKQVPIWGELELAYRLKPTAVSIAAVTGTNGNTTTTH